MQERRAHAPARSKLLQEAGFGKLANVEGGILAWAEQIDTKVPKY